MPVKLDHRQVLYPFENAVLSVQLRIWLMQAAAPFDDKVDLQVLLTTRSD